MSRFEFKRLAKWRTGGTGDHMELSIPLPTSASGLVHRWCPSSDCQPRRFQLGPTAKAALAPDTNRQRRSPGEPICTCPYCGTDEGDDAFVFPEDQQAALEKVEWAVQEDVGRWMEDVARDFNRSVNRGGGNFLNIKMTSSHRSRPEPRPWREDLLRAMECHLCARTYGVYAIAFSCPDCGAANFANHFEREVALVIGQVDLAEHLESENARELAFRLLGNAHEDVVTSFETYLKSAFRLVLAQRPGAAEIVSEGARRGNPFQNLKRAAGLFEKVGVDLFADVSREAYSQLSTDFEKRHVVGHNLGLADKRYAEASSDTKIGETIPLLGSEIEAFAKTCLSVVVSLESALPELRPPSV